MESFLASLVEFPLRVKLAALHIQVVEGVKLLTILVLRLLTGLLVSEIEWFSRSSSHIDYFEWYYYLLLLEDCPPRE